MIDHGTILLALRSKLLTLEAATTGSTSISATTTGYGRAAGSFIADGFRAGMEVTGSGFTDSSNNAAKTITSVSATSMTCDGCATEAAGTRTISAALPANRSWTNVVFEPTQGEPWVEEQYLPGPMLRTGLGPTAQLEVRPMYNLRIYVPANVGIDGALQYADSLLTLFAPGTEITVGSGSTLTVRGDVAPFVGQMQQADAGFAVVPVTVPLRLRTANSI